MSKEPDERVIVPGKETIVRRRGAEWSFHLPEQHAIQLDEEKGLVHLRTPLEGTTYELAGLEETEDEVIVRLGADVGRHGPPGFGPEVPEARGYPLPEIQEEFQRLRGRWERAGHPETEFDVWAQGSSHEDQLRKIRRRLRQ